MNRLSIATRGSALALWQARAVAARVRVLRPDLPVEVLEVRTEGDRDQGPEEQEDARGEPDETQGLLAGAVRPVERVAQGGRQPQDWNLEVRGDHSKQRGIDKRVRPP